jgi:CHAT domain-containing protein
MKLKIFVLHLILLFACAAQAEESITTLVQNAQKYRLRGDISQVVQSLSDAMQQAKTVQEVQAVSLQLGESLIEMRQFDRAEKLLIRSASSGSDRSRAQAMIDLGNLKFRQKLHDEARKYYKQSMDLTDSPEIRWVAEMNLSYFEPPIDRLNYLKGLADRLPEIDDDATQTKLAVGLGDKATSLGLEGHALALRIYDIARQKAIAAKDTIQLAKAYDGIAQINEVQRHYSAALKATELGVSAAQQANAIDVLIGLEARRGRLLRIANRLQAAQEAYSRSVEYIQQLRYSIPVEYENGRSSFRDTLEPIYLELADLLLQKGAVSIAAEQQRLYRQARDTIELLKQSEIDDYLGDRCVPAIDVSAKINPGTAVLYPILLKERVDLLLETHEGIYRGSSSVLGEEVRSQALQLARLMREEMPLGQLPKTLYDELLLPVEAKLALQKIDILIVVPDGALRLIPFAALHTGNGYLAEKFAVSVVPGMTVLAQSDVPQGQLSTLLSGMSEVGDVVTKLTPNLLAEISPATPDDKALAPLTVGERNLAQNLSQVTMQLRQVEVTENQSTLRESRLKEALALPGVKEEISEIRKISQGDVLFNESFTVENFRREVTSGHFRIVHIASHGVFGGSAETSYILAYDDLIGLNSLQHFLSSEDLEASPIELLTLSACQTAEGNDRAPLGITGAALKARSKAALGSLWPVSDDATMALMSTFYRNLTKGGMSKVKALQKAQLDLMHRAKFRHPFYWAPFILVGNWQ